MAKKRLTGYTFDASEKTVVHADFSDITLAGIQLIVNVTDQIIIYNFADTAKGGTLATDTLTLEYDTTSMSDTDELMVLVEDGVAAQVVSSTDLDIRNLVAATDLVTAVPPDDDTASGTVASEGTQAYLLSSGRSSISWQFTGTWTGTVYFEKSLDNTNWVEMAYVTSEAVTANDVVTETTSNGVYFSSLGSTQRVRIRRGVGTGTLSFNVARSVGVKVVALNKALPSGDNNIGNVDIVTSALPTGASTSANQATIIGHVDGVETLLGTIDADTSALAGTVSGAELQVDIITAPTLTVNSHEVTNAGVFAAQIDGAALTALQLIDDPVATLGTTTYSETTTKGMMIGAVRRDADTTLVDTTNEISPLQVDANGRLKVEVFSGEALPVTATNATAANLKAEVTIASAQTLATLTNLVQMNGVNISLNTGVRDTGTQRVTIATDDLVPVSGTVTADTELNAAAALADAASATVSTATVGAVPLLMNATTLDRARAVINTLNSTGTGIQASGMVAQFDDVSPTAITENLFGPLRISANRNLFNTIRDAAGNERGVNVDVNNNLQVVNAAETTKVLGVVRTADGSGTLTVSGSGNATGALRVELPNNGTGVIATVSNVATIGTSVTPGTGATNLGKAEDAGHTTGDVGVMALAVRAASPTERSAGPTDGDYEPLAVNEVGAAWVTQTPSANGGSSTMNATSSDGGTALTATAQAIKASAGTLRGYYIYNPNVTAQFVQFYNTVSGSVTVGTTNPLFMLTIPATSGANMWSNDGIQFSTAMSWAATSTAGGNGAPGTALDAVCWFK